MDQSKSATMERPGGNDKVGRSISLCRIHHDADQTHRTVIMNYRTDGVIGVYAEGVAAPFRM